MKSYAYLLLTICFFAFSPVHLTAQTRTTYQVSANSPLNPNMGGYLYENQAGTYDLIAHPRFRFDSAYISLVKLDANFTPGLTKSFTMSQRLQVNHVEPTTDGYVVSGMNGGQVVSFPFLVKVDTAFNLQWSRHFKSLDLSQTQIKLAVSTANTVSCYSYSSPADDIVYRFDTDLNATSFSGTNISHLNWDFRMYQGIPSGVTGTHVIGGTAEVKTTGENEGLLLSWGTNGLGFSNAYDFGNSVSEEVNGLIMGADGNLFVTVNSFNSDSNFFHTFLCKLTPTGSIIWSKKLSLPDGLVFLSVTHETASGDLFLSGRTDPLVPTMVKCNSSGEIVWTRRWIPPAVGLAGMGYGLKKASGDVILQGIQQDLFFAEADSDAVACSFAAGPPITSEDFTQYTVTPITFTFSSFTVDEDSMPIFPRSLSFNTTPYCDTMTVGIDDKRDAILLTLYPQPAHDFLFIESKEVKPDTKISIYNISGQLEHEFPFQNKIDIRTWQRGWKMIRVSDGERSASRVVWMK